MHELSVSEQAKDQMTEIYEYIYYDLNSPQGADNTLSKIVKMLQ